MTTTEPRIDAGPHTTTPAVAALLQDLRIAERVVVEEAAALELCGIEARARYEAHEAAKLARDKVLQKLKAEVSK